MVPFFFGEGISKRKLVDLAKLKTYAHTNAYIPIHVHKKKKKETSCASLSYTDAEGRQANNNNKNSIFEHALEQKNTTPKQSQGVKSLEPFVLEKKPFYLFTFFFFQAQSLSSSLFFFSLLFFFFYLFTFFSSICFCSCRERA